MNEAAQVLLRFLDHPRAHVVGILEGLSDDQLRRPVLPSGWSCLGNRDEIRQANAIIEATPLDAPPRRRDPWWGDWQVPDLRYIMLHVLTETACHAGHLDAVRELLDGRQWIAL